ncbi:LOW QUALITY PROTEIN: hypothetical protein OSB04_016172 [Centaurea solstitialis]|uniref:Disease resistance R13L4/SHOC-2-like LRR domain-containing protein n=1 Tax=Centaurea solstitialis TaxID=347529 RepID=A0AA38W878_9ASTR|nr:LOW QUALITY PROTEIN: hypothetical protein OSB04_016172 [Centaurea solstitialis]
MQEQKQVEAAPIHHELEKVRNLKKRVKDAAEEAQDTIDLYLSGLHFRNRGLSLRSEVFITSLDLEKVTKSIESIKVELMTINIANMKMDSSSRIDHVKTRFVAPSYTRNPFITKKRLEEFVVGLDDDAEIIRDKLTEDTKQLCVVSIYHFHIRAWATVSQTYIKRDFLIQILTSIGVQGDLEDTSDSQLREKLHKKLMGRITTPFKVPCNCKNVDFMILHGPLLLHLRYLAIASPYSSEFSKSICKLWSLQTLIIHTYSTRIYLPRNLQDMLNLRHLWSNAMIYFPYIEKPMNLQSITRVTCEHGVDNLKKCLPIIKKLDLCCSEDEEYHFELLPYLETLAFVGSGPQRNHIWFPATLKTLTLTKCCLPKSDMSTIKSLPNLEVLELFHNAFMGAHRDACEQQFRQLKFLLLYHLNLKQWEASSTSFPCLKRLSLRRCEDLEEIPFEIGEITTLELIAIKSSNNSVVESVKRIQQEQQDVGNDELKITINGMDLSQYEGSNK